ncbi:uncharacterized protein LOC112548334 [Alligator sinensis]|uniref:Uncharacterized protein LOC112548334 n=1 Tax=Alligator sinensis TaxID=38654 RepID=A0A3Q0FPH2_ALLSI|nr:uncharacterized protein LOC112548334 [Alligator sinensis]
MQNSSEYVCACAFQTVGFCACAHTCVHVYGCTHDFWVPGACVCVPDTWVLCVWGRGVHVSWTPGECVCVCICVRLGYLSVVSVRVCPASLGYMCVFVSWIPGFCLCTCPGYMHAPAQPGYVSQTPRFFCLCVSSVCASILDNWVVCARTCVFVCVLDTWVLCVCVMCCRHLGMGVFPIPGGGVCPSWPPGFCVHLCMWLCPRCLGSVHVPLCVCIRRTPSCLGCVCACVLARVLNTWVLCMSFACVSAYVSWVPLFSVRFPRPNFLFLQPFLHSTCPPPPLGGRRPLCMLGCPLTGPHPMILFANTNTPPASFIPKISSPQPMM